MTSEKRQKTLLAVLGVALLLAGWKYVRPVLARLTPGTGVTILGADGDRAKLASLANQEVVDLRMDALAPAGYDYAPGRNIFRTVDPPPPAPPPPVAPPPPPPQVAPPPPPPTGRVPPQIDVTLLGIFGPEHRRIAVLTDGEEIINALERDEIREMFILERIGLESVDLGFVGFPDEPPETLEIGS